MNKITYFATLMILILFSVKANAIVTALKSQYDVNLTEVMKIHFIDVGQGNCVLIKYPDGRFMLVDCGTLENRCDKPEEVIDKINKYTKKIDYVLLTHGDKDHCSYISEIFKAGGYDCPIDFYYGGDRKTYPLDVTKLMDDCNKKFGSNVTGFKKKSIPKTFKGKNSEFSLNMVAVYVSNGKNKNTDSIVLSAEFDRFRALLMADATGTTEDAILEDASRGSIESNLLFVGHHGSNGSSTKAFIEAVDPKIAIYSSSAKKSTYKHPSCSILKRIRAYLHTEKNSRVTLMTHTIKCYEDDKNLNKNDDSNVAEYLTATQGDITLTTDGHNYQIDVEKLS